MSTDTGTNIKIKKFLLHMPPKLHSALKTASFLTNTSMNTLIVESVTDKLNALSKIVTMPKSFKVPRKIRRTKRSKG